MHFMKKTSCQIQFDYCYSEIEEKIIIVMTIPSLLQPFIAVSIVIVLFHARCQEVITLVQYNCRFIKYRISYQWPC